MQILLLAAVLVAASASLNAQVVEESERTRGEANDTIQEDLAGRFEKLFLRERRNQWWAVSAEESISAVMTALRFIRPDQVEVVCRTSICRIDIDQIMDEQFFAYGSEVEAALALIGFSRPLGLTRRNSMIRFYSTWTPLDLHELIAR